MPESAESYRARTGYIGLIERCVICWEIRPRHWTTPHVFKGGRLVFIEVEQEREGETSSPRGEKP
jgi:hypothetical protein